MDYVLAISTLVVNASLGWFKGVWWTWLIHGINAGVWIWYSYQIDQMGFVWLSLVTLVVDGYTMFYKLGWFDVYYQWIRDANENQN